MNLDIYNSISEGSIGYIKLPRALFEVSGKEAVQFLNGLITNDVKALEDGDSMLAAFPNAQGRLLAVVRVRRKGDAFLIETEEATREKIYQNLFRFTFAGDFFLEDRSAEYSFYRFFGEIPSNIAEEAIIFGNDIFLPNDSIGNLENFNEISEDAHEILRIERGIPLYGIDMDESTIVSELGFPDIISYKKGCYIGQEIIARIHFRGHVAKELRGLILEDGNAVPGDELKSLDGKNAGRVTSVIFSPRFNKNIALSYVRYDYLADGNELKIGESIAKVKNLPFV